jgi:predicted regulator of amino acid metabolism with ACT domain
MTSIRSIVERAIEQDAAIKKGLARGIINVRALARFIQRKLGLTTSLDAIISAIRRYPLEEKIKKFGEADDLLKRCRFTMKNRVVDVCLVKDTNVQKKISEIVPIINFDRGEVMRVVSGVESIKMILDEKNLDRVLRHFQKSEIIDVTKNLSEITISISREAERRPGIVSKIATEFALNDINLVEIMSCAPELIIVVNEKDSLKAYGLLEELAS